MYVDSDYNRGQKFDIGVCYHHDSDRGLFEFLRIGHS